MKKTYSFPLRTAENIMVMEVKRSFYQQNSLENKKLDGILYKDMHELLPDESQSFLDGKTSNTRLQTRVIACSIFLNLSTLLPKNVTISFTLEEVKRHVKYCFVTSIFVEQDCFQTKSGSLVTATNLIYFRKVTSRIYSTTASSNLNQSLLTEETLALIYTRLKVLETSIRS